MFFNIKFRGKSNLYGRLLVFVFLLSLTFIISSESLFFSDHPNGPKIGITIVSLLLIGFFIVAIELILLLGKYGQKVKVFLYACALIVIISGLYTANPFLEVISNDSKPTLYSYYHAGNLISYLIFSFFILRDIFSSKKTHSDHIWGAIVLYFMLIFVFAELYELICLFIPGMLGETYEIGWPNYIHCYAFSMNAISGIDLVYPNAHDLFKKMAIIENIIGNLFLVVILGRLLSHPLEKKSN